MKRERGIAACGLACCLCTEKCEGCNSGDCPEKDYCENRKECCLTESMKKRAKECITEYYREKGEQVMFSDDFLYFSIREQEADEK